MSWGFAFIALIGFPGLARAVTFTDVSNPAGLFDANWPAHIPDGSLDPPGVLVVDINGDNWLDFFVPLEVAGVPDRLYINNGDGTFTESAAAWGIGDTNLTKSALFFDYDNDGLLDLILANLLSDRTPVLRLFHHRPGASFFDDVTVGSGMDMPLPGDGFPTGMAAGDLNDDGFLDLIVPSKLGTVGTVGTDTCLRSMGDGTFIEDALTLGAASTDSRSWQAHFADFDLDGRIDLLLSEDTDTLSRLFRNMTAWSVSNVSSQANISGIGAPDMGIAVGDYDNDGDFDVYLTDITLICPYTNSIGGNRFYRNNRIPTGSLTFSGEAAINGTSQAGVSWGCTFIDFDNDTWLDLAVASMTCNSRLFHNLGTGSFEGVGSLSGFAPSVMGGGVIAFDYDRDGDLDLLLMGRDLSPMLFRNDGGNANHWLTVDPVFEIGNRQAIGTVVRLTTGGLTMMRQINAGTSFKSQEPDEAHFGLAAATQADSVNIVWPDGSFETHTSVSADQFITYRRVQGDFDWDGAVTPTGDLPVFISVLLGQTTTANELLRSDMNRDGIHDAADIQPFVTAMIMVP